MELYQLCLFFYCVIFLFLKFQMLFEDISQYADHVRFHIDLLGSEDRDQRSLLRCCWRGVFSCFMLLQSISLCSEWLIKDS